MSRMADLGITLLDLEERLPTTPKLRRSIEAWLKSGRGGGFAVDLVVAPFRITVGLTLRGQRDWTTFSDAAELEEESWVRSYVGRELDDVRKRLVGAAR